MSPVAPVITSAIFDQSSYTAGQKMTLTVNYTPGTSADAETVNIVGTDTATGLPASVTVNLSVGQPDSMSWSVTDSKGRVYLLASDDGAVAVFTATA